MEEQFQSVRPDVAPGPGEAVAEAPVESVIVEDDFAQETQPGERPAVITPDLRSDMFVNRFFAAACYVPLGFLIALYLKPDSRFSIYHARQGLVVFFVQFIGSLFTAVPYVGFVIFGFTLFLSIIGIVSSLRANDYFHFPLLGDIASKFTFI